MSRPTVCVLLAALVGCSAPEHQERPVVEREPRPNFTPTPPPEPEPLALTDNQKRYCYNIAITYGHMRESIAKANDRRAWRTMRCGEFLERGLPRGPLPPAVDSAYTAAAFALIP